MFNHADRSDASRRDENGMTTISYVLATGLSLIFISWAVIFVVFSYTRGAIRGAAERGTRAGVVEYSLSRDATRAINACNSTFNTDINGAIRGSLRNTLISRCEIRGTQMHVVASATVISFSSTIPNIGVNEDTSRSFEKAPTP